MAEGDLSKRCKTLILMLFVMGILTINLGPSPVLADIFRMNGDAFIWVTDSEAYGAGGNDLLLVSYDYSDSSWALTWGSAGQEHPAALDVSPNGEIVVAGSFPGVVPGNTSHAHLGEAFVVKYTRSGVRVWEKGYSWSNWNLNVSDICCDGAGSTYLAGTAYQNKDLGEYSGVTFIMKIDTGGNVLWAKRFANSYVEGFQGVAVNAGSLVCVGHTKQKQTPDFAALIALYDSTDGTLLNATSYNFQTGDARLSEVEYDNHGGFWAAGLVTSGRYVDEYAPMLSRADKDVLLIRLAADGECVWFMSRGGKYPEYLNDLYVTAAGDAMLLGSTVAGYLPPVGESSNGVEDNNSLLMLVKRDTAAYDVRSSIPGSGSDCQERIWGMCANAKGVGLLAQLDADELALTEDVSLDKKVNYTDWQEVSYNEDESCAISVWPLEGFTETRPAVGAQEVGALVQSLGYFTSILNLDN